ncbi:MAG: GNAT family N-acetyltransferase [Clostridium sp.]|nr:GNAT family N-acetyltransferase [Clostridium sp.]
MIKQASENDIRVIEDILSDAVRYLDKAGIPNQWNETSIKWDKLSKDYKIGDFYIAYENDIPAGCMALTDHDEKYWPETIKGQSLYLHKLVVKREFSGKGFSKELIDFAKKLTHESGAHTLRLDCNYYRDKLRSIYEGEGFSFVRSKSIGHNIEMALYEYID